MKKESVMNYRGISGRRRQWSPDEKFRIVMESLKGRESNVQVCQRFRISEPTLYKWRQLFFDGGRAFLEQSSKPSIGALLAENRRLKELVADLWLKVEGPARSRRVVSARERLERGS